MKQFEPGCEHRAIRAECSLHGERSEKDTNVFTDDDLKRLKNEMDHTDHYPKLGALLARLEAAESVIEEMNCSNCIEWTQDAKIAWRKAAGK